MTKETHSRTRGGKTAWVLSAVLWLLALTLIGLPLYLTLVVALKSPEEMANVLTLPQSLRLDNFAEAFRLTDFPRTFTNTLLITVLALIFTILTNSFVAYAVERNRDKRFFGLLYYYFVSAMFIPFNIIMLPLVKQASRFYLDNQYGIIFLYVIFGLPMNVFLYTGFLKSTPRALDEAATIDGANVWQTFFYIIFPVLKPISATVAILTVLWTWNDFLMPLVLLSEPHQQTLQLAQYVFQGQFSTNYNLAFASYCMVLLPILLVYVFAQRWIISGVTNGAIKA